MLFISIRHLDHWPAPLVRAYAEDCFGERLWVDDEKCKDLVQNLSLIHRHDSNKYNVVQDQYTNELSQRIALRHSRHTDYRSGEIVSIIEPQTNTNTQKGFRGDSKYDNESSDSDSGDEKVIVEEISVGSASNAASQMNQKSLTEINHSHNILKRKEDKDKLLHEENNDEIIISVMDSGSVSTLGKRKSPPIISSSLSNVTKHKKLDQLSVPHEIIANLGDNIQKKMLSKHQDPLLNLQKIRPRFIGVNKSLAFQVISEALSDRLKLKTRQYSRLLSTLKEFVSIPKVRSLIAQNLERWLQSPALSGLARNLFSLIVKNMKNNYPPLQDDIDTIDSILAMKLKVNQVSSPKSMSYFTIYFDDSYIFML